MQNNPTNTKEQEDLKILVETFFKNIKAVTSWNNNILNIDKVPQDFEKLFGKKAPYGFVFDNSNSNIETELISKGSSLLKLIASYLDKQAQTTILKIQFNSDIKNEIKKSIDLNDFEIMNTITKNINDYIYRFTIGTTFQYLNEKEQIINTIYIHDKSIENNFKVEDYNTIDGKKEEVILTNIKDQYSIAKDNIRVLIQKRISEISEILNKSIEKEIWRIETHYLSQIHEIDNEIQDNENKIKELEKKLAKSSESNKKSIQEKISHNKETNEKLKESEDKQRFIKEKDFFINDEKQKHSLNISNNLINSTIIYYPIYKTKLSLKNKLSNINKDIELEYNPLTKKLSPLLCDSCKNKIKSIEVCSSNHISCKNCLKRCPSCSKIICPSCKSLECSICGIKTCPKCESSCHICKKPVCKNHSCKDNMTGKNLCNNCAVFCTVCNKYTSKNNIKRCENCRSPACIKCLKTRFLNNKSRLVCDNCNK